MNITYLSPATAVNMGDAWFEMASLDHFWIRRRFEVFRSLWLNGSLDGNSAEIGCGTGLVLQQVRATFGVEIDGYDLNLFALEQASRKLMRLHCYNVHDRLLSLKQAYNNIFCFDVIEHLEDDAGFIDSVLFHLKPGGRVIVNVPANQLLFSKYDRSVGHQRRYNISMLKSLCAKTGLEIEIWSYWAPVYLPILLLRAQMLKHADDSEVTEKGFSPRSKWSNSLMLALGRIDYLPNHWAGASLMAVLRSRS